MSVKIEIKEGEKRTERKNSIKSMKSNQDSREKGEKRNHVKLSQLPSLSL